MPENLTHFTPKQRKAIESLLTSWDTTQAAEAAGVSRDTLYRWLKDLSFQEALRRATQQALDGLSRGLVVLSAKAQKVLSDAMDGDFPLQAGARVRAADIVLSKLLQLRELVDLEARISALEARQK